ncbi:MAG: patatin-like phospholipase family protein [Myxococcaceae bacterium]
MAVNRPPLRTGLVLGGGGARGAYEAGVLAYLREELEHELGRPLPLPVIAGTSVGAINACHVAAYAEDGKLQARELVERWRSLSIHEVLRFGAGDLIRVAREVLGRVPDLTEERNGGLIDPAGIYDIVLRGVPWKNIGRSIRAGRLHGVAVSATHVATGRTTVFIQMRDLELPAWTRDPHLRAEAALIGPHHALASAAIPLMFPAVQIGGRLYLDGGLRLNVPLSPALRMGAERVIVVSLRHLEIPPPGPEEPEGAAERAVATAPFLFGKTLNALMLDRTDQDLERLRRLNSMLIAGTEAYGKDFAQVLNGALLPHRNSGVRYVRNILVRPSEDIGQLASLYARSEEFSRRAKGMASTVVKRLVDREAPDSADLVSYLLFDGGFADVLVAMGKNDARKMRDQWVRFFSDDPECDAEAAQLARTA